jgi:hypothetical protein
MTRNIYRPSTEWRDGPASPFGPTRTEQDWLNHGACTKPGVDPNWFVAEESDTAAIEQAKAVCRCCPVRLQCRIHGFEVNEWGVYAGLTYSEREQLRRVIA